MLIGIFGTGRNGSTLIMRLLDGIPDSFILPVEINFLSRLNDLASNGHISRASVLNATIKPLKSLGIPANSHLLIQSYEQYIRYTYEKYISQIEGDISLGKDPLTALNVKSSYMPAEFVNSFLHATSDWINNNQSVDHYFFKTTETAYIGDYEKMFPDMRFLHIIRNPLQVCSSQKRTIMCYKTLPSWYLGRDNLETMLEKRWIPHAKTIIKRSLSDKHYVVRYEDLTNDPVNIIAGICKWLVVSLPTEPTKQTVLGGRLMKKLPANPSKKGAETPVDVVPKLNKVLKYEEVLTIREKQFITFRTYSYAKKLGYFDKMTNPKKFPLLAKWIVPDKWEFIHSNSVAKMLKTLIALAYRRYYIFRQLLFVKH